MTDPMPTTLIWRHYKAKPGFMDEQRKAMRDFREGRAVPLSEVRMTDPYFDPIEEAEKVAKDPETAPQAPNDWPKPDGREPLDPDAETQGGTEPE